MEVSYLTINNSLDFTILKDFNYYSLIFVILFIFIYIIKCLLINLLLVKKNELFNKKFWVIFKETLTKMWYINLVIYGIFKI